MTRPLLRVAFVVAGLFAGTAADADACSCIAPDVSTPAKLEQAVRAQLGSSNAVFLGTIVELTDFAVTFTVEKLWKGEVRPRLVMGTALKSVGGGRVELNSCLLSFAGGFGRRYVVFADGATPDRLTAGRCGFTGEYEQSRPVEGALNRLTIPRSPEWSEAHGGDYLTALQSAETTWAKHRPAAYEYTIEIACFCYLDRRSVTFSVSDGKSELLDKVEDRFRSSYDSYNSIDKLFAILRRTAVMGPDKMAVEYEDSYGYPRRADLDPREMVKDDELRFRITAFRPLGSGR